MSDVGDLGEWAWVGTPGFAGLIIAGFMLWGQPSSPYEGFAAINPLGQFLGALIMFFGLGFIPGLIVSLVLNAFGLLRVPPEVELMGLDFSTDEARNAAIKEVQAAERAAVVNGVVR